MGKFANVCKVLMFMLLAGSSAGGVAEELAFDYCMVCHGPNANGNQAIGAPKLSGMEGWNIDRQLKAFNAGYRGEHYQDGPGLDTRSVAWILTDQAVIDDAVAYIASLSYGLSRFTINGDVSRVKSLFGSCVVCHGARAERNAALHAPALVQQSDW